MMLAPPSEYTYSPSSGYQQTTQLLHHQSDERPRIYGLDPAQNPGQPLQGPMSGMPMMNYHQQMMHPQNGTPQHANMTPQNAMTPQHAVMTPSQYEHEPLVMNVAPTGHYYAPMGTHMLLVSSDFDYANANANGMNGSGSIASSTSSSKGGNKPGTKRSREDLNLKEKKRMFKLNDRITQLKQMLEDAGVQTKKNKQSVLDNAAYFIEQLQSDLMIAKQKAERAEREAEKLKTKQTQSKPDAAATMLHECFRQSSTPRVITDAALVPVQANAAFLAYAGVNDDASLRAKDRLVPLLCADAAKLDAIVRQVLQENRVVHSTVHVESAEGPSAVLLVATAIKDGKAATASHIEFSVLSTADSESAPASTEAAAPVPASASTSSASASAASTAESGSEDAASSDATDASSGSEPEEEGSA